MPLRSTAVAAPRTPARAAFGLAVRVTRRATVAWAAGLGLTTLVGPSTYAAAFPGSAERRLLAASIGDNPAFRALYGRPVALDTPGGFVQWRYTAFLAVLAAVWGLLAGSRLLRGEEENGRADLVATAGLPTQRLLQLQFGALVTGAAGIFVALTVGATIGGLAVGGSALLAAGVAGAGLIFALLAAAVSQVAITRRQAASWTGLALGVAFLLRAVADSVDGLGWLGWLSPIGWATRTEPFTSPTALPLIAVAGVATVLALIAGGLRRHRDLGGTALVLPDRGTASPRLLGSPLAFAARTSRGITLAWFVGLGGVAFLFGLLAPDVVAFARRDEGLGRIAADMGRAAPDTTEGFVGFTFAFVIVVLAVMATTLVGALRDEEVSGRLDTVLSRPVRRGRWFAGRVLVALTIVVLVAGATGAAAWAGIALRGGGASFPTMVRAGLNGVPVAVAFLGLALLVFAAAPRHTSAVIGLVVGLNLVELVGSVTRAPTWLLGLSPFHYVAPVPAAPVDRAGALVLVAVGAITTVAAAHQFGRRDLEAD